MYAKQIEVLEQRVKNLREALESIKGITEMDPWAPSSYINDCADRVYDAASDALTDDDKIIGYKIRTGKIVGINNYYPEHIWLDVKIGNETYNAYCSNAGREYKIGQFAIIKIYFGDSKTGHYPNNEVLDNF